MLSAKWPWFPPSMPIQLPSHKSRTRAGNILARLLLQSWDMGHRRS